MPLDPTVPHPQSPPASGRDVATFGEFFDAADAMIQTAVYGASAAVRLSLVCLFAGGHLLIEDLPGVGKTTLARTLALVAGGRAARVQFTPDLLPSDILGVNVFHPGTQEFTFRAGPVFANVVHADEINRASPKVQSALLEVMEERRVTTDGVSRAVPEPFFVIATQNPVELEGTFRLPEAQLDRFLVRVSMGMPSAEDEVDMVAGITGAGSAPSNVRQVLTAENTVEMVECAARVHASRDVIDYAARITRSTRDHPDVRIGASPRATLGLVRAARVVAAADRRTYVTADDVRWLAPHVLTHRIECRTSATMGGTASADIVRQAIASARVPQRRSESAPADR